MSPAIDATVTLDAWPSDGDVVKDVREVETVGGKGINVARWLAKRGCNVVCTGLLGEDNVAQFEREFKKYGIEERFVRVPGATRRNEMIVTPTGSFKLNRPAFPHLSAGDFKFDFAKLGVEPGDVVILSGSLPKCCGDDFYARAVDALAALGAQVVLDASGAPLKLAVCSRALMRENADGMATGGISLIKPNADECMDLVGFVPHVADEFARAFELLRERVDGAIISDGGAGAWCDGEFFAAPKVDVLDTTAAGDTLLAEYCHRKYACGSDACGSDACGSDAADAMRWAVAAGSAACTMPGGEPPPVELVERLYESMI